ncbi:MAG: hypothetical protein COB02_05275 [Candidatus Cloacimonadota bacterium]|nr:MAG: hypothetical protein COB02_05275 [Candidatus Cloacimonadota bacterium]
MKYSLLVGTIYCMLSVILGAFGAHALKAKLSEYSMGVFQTGVQYQMYHGLALILLYACFKSAKQIPAMHYAFIFFTLGTILFSGSLYLIAFTEIKKFGMITPIGGLAFIFAWLCFAYASTRINIS